MMRALSNRLARVLPEATFQFQGAGPLSCLSRARQIVSDELATMLESPEMQRAAEARLARLLADSLPRDTVGEVEATLLLVAIHDLEPTAASRAAWLDRAGSSSYCVRLVAHALDCQVSRGVLKMAHVQY